MSQASSSSPAAASGGRSSAATGSPPGRRSCSAEKRAQTASSSGRSTWQETTAYRSAGVPVMRGEVSSARPMRRSTAILVVAACAAVPRLAVLAREREAILEEFVDKSDRFATTLVEHGTFGFLPGVPSAYTQPLYGWFLAALYWPFGRSWLAVGLAQIAVAVATALVVLAIGTLLRSTGDGRRRGAPGDAPPVRRLARRPCEPRGPRRPPARARSSSARCSRTRTGASGWPSSTGIVAGAAILGNARLALLPIALAVYVAWRVRPGRRAVAAAVALVAAAAVVVAPWVVRNEAQVGCFALTTDARALWKANNANTYDVLDRGGWIDDVPELPGAPPWPELAADLTLAGQPTSVDECAQMRLYREEVLEFWREHPGEKGRLALQATRMLWSPVPSESDESGSGLARTRAEDGRARVRARPVRARDRRPLRRARAASSRSPCSCSATTRSRRWSSPGRRGTGSRGTSCSRCSPRSRSPRSGSGTAGGATRARRRRARRRRAPRSAARCARA